LFKKKIKSLLQKGYNVNASIRSLKNEKKIENFIKCLTNENQKGKLEFFEADLLQIGSFQKCFENVTGVFHVASPVILFPKVKILKFHLTRTGSI
jgi:nucleoside-diphosphate-sugar epimerase